MVTLSQLLRRTLTALEPLSLENTRFEAGCLIKAATGLSDIAFLTQPDTSIPEPQQAAVEAMLSRRLSGEPLQYILGEWEFYGFPFKVGEGVLIPRQDTETLVELAEPHLSPNMLCADLCAGSGCIGISLAKRIGCKFHSYELSDKALGYLKENIALNEVQSLVTAINADVLSEETVEAAPMYDAILTNPPYLTAKDMSELMPEVKREPEMALFGGEDGLSYYREILRLWTKRLKNGGFIAAEIGMGQENDVIAIFAENGIEAAAHKDACGIYRVVCGVKK